ncbi:AbrB/MazE/SpoVT family DNA-binding domain-containing protein [Aerophototrophica crusticola]|uniref:AbrB/MazE/SpoVT family DNA-binding domain-containing protein n=1 Tax=Aerophototrophica crusticola TaxID=1709002 RepID=A0A858R4G0_9PROT|nr:AbrB/MazE/SpoVT family DNA-binding domain-containing protein [Rhodospirillaceae bacterium B3]
MHLQLARWGNSLALRIPTAYAKDLGIAEGAGVDARVEDGKLVITPLADPPTYDLDELLAGITDDNIHGEVPTGKAVGNEFP